jgi:hypothetical protein
MEFEVECDHARDEGKIRNLEPNNTDKTLYFEKFRLMSVIVQAKIIGNEIINAVVA